MPAARRLDVSSKEIQGFREVEACLARDLLKFLRERLRRRGIGTMVKTGLGQAAARGRRIEWAVVARSQFITQVRPLIRIAASTDRPEPSFDVLELDSVERCVRCLGTGGYGLDRSGRFATRETARTTGVGSNRGGSALPRSLQEAESALFWLLDECRADGSLDGLVERIDEALYSMRSKHIIDYFIDFSVWYKLGQKTLTRGIGRLTPASACVTEVDGSKRAFSSWSEAYEHRGEARPVLPGKYRPPCPDCDGRGAGTNPR